MRILKAFVFLSGVAILSNLFMLQLTKKGERWRRLGKSQFIVKVKTPAERGEIFDRNGRPLALNLPALVLYQIKDRVKDRKGILRRLGIKRRKRLGRRKALLLADGVPFNLEDELRRIDGLYVRRSWGRNYPISEAILSLLGFTGRNGHGLEGIEYSFEEPLSGKPGSELLLRTNDRSYLSMLKETPALRGADLYLTIDSDLEEMAYEALKRKVIETEASSGFVIIMNPQNGEILALANYPSYPYPDALRVPHERWKNRAITDPYEPGSTFKVVLYSVAYEEGLISPEDSVDTEDGYVIVQGHRIRDVHKMGKTTYREALVHSSNVAAAKLALEVGPRKLYEMARRLGFGCKTGINLYGESTGRLRPLSRWKPINTANFGMGQGILVNGIQMALAYSAIANGGYLLAPKLVKRVDFFNRTFVPPERIVVRKALSDTVTRILTEILTEVVDSGTGRAAKIEGIRIAGKTGTAQKVDPQTHRYSRDRVTTSFIGYFPADNPRYLINVVIDEPRKGRFGGTVAAPLFREIALKILAREYVELAGLRN